MEGCGRRRRQVISAGFPTAEGSGSCASLFTCSLTFPLRNTYGFYNEIKTKALFRWLHKWIHVIKLHRNTRVQAHNKRAHIKNGEIRPEWGVQTVPAPTPCFDMCDNYVRYYQAWGGGGGSGRDSTQELSVLFLQPPGREGLFQNKSKKKIKLPNYSERN